MTSLSFGRVDDARTVSIMETGPLTNASDPVRLRTLTLIRWVAIIGQVLTLIVVHFGFGFPVPMAPAFVIVGTSLLLNLVVMTGHPTTVHLGERAVAAFLGFDVLQLAALLYLTGGLENPFSFLLLAPVAVSATILSVRSTIALCVLSIICISILAINHYPLPWSADGFAVPQKYVLGTWVALVIGIIFFAIYTWRVAEEARRMSNALAASQQALAREQQLAALGGLAAAAAHELGSPLGTIAVVSGEIARDLTAESAIYEDVQLLISETARCRDILEELSDRSADDIDSGSPFALLPLQVLVQAAADRHQRGNVRFSLIPRALDVASPEPVVVRSPEIVHGLGNIIQNAAQFAEKNVNISTGWDEEHITVIIQDDGPGFPSGLVERLGEPYISSRTQPGGHMGLGIFIARTLLQRSGASITFQNSDVGGAVVEVFWRREALEAQGKEALQ
ncbi:MAG: ActS/PrrB/RegB family redox-sensitive histidine kinase [Pseudomonadota bacterium]|nr:ActS/PrrB/RegB family redox-sensitive histidine kinase [Pseudomonadota bacterium]